MNIKPIPTPSALVADITTHRVSWSDHQRSLLRTLLRFDDWTKPPHSSLSPVDVLRVFADTIAPYQRVGSATRRTIRRITRRWSVTINITLDDTDV